MGKKSNSYLQRLKNLAKARSTHVLETSLSTTAEIASSTADIASETAQEEFVTNKLPADAPLEQGFMDMIFVVESDAEDEDNESQALEDFFQRSKQKQDSEPVPSSGDVAGSSEMEVNDIINEIISNSSEENLEPLEEAVPTAHEKLQELLHDLSDRTKETSTDIALRKSNWQNFPVLKHAQDELTVKSKDKKIDVFFRAQNWLHKLDWRYGKKKNGMYIDGHKREDVVAYWTEFLKQMKEYFKRTAIYDNKGNAIEPKGFPVEGGRFRIILVTHDKSTFYANDDRKTQWNHVKEKATPQPKGEGQSLMVSDFLTFDWGQLVDGEEEARILFKAGKNRDGYFTSEELLAQIDKAIIIFEGKTQGCSIGLFLFDNAPSHQWRSPTALSAWKMSKGPSKNWTHKKDGPKMRPGTFANGTFQDFYFPDDHPLFPSWFKEMEEIIQE
ncbi:hypothetical protein M422DRAFT_272559 [Sphaerobolus stellatus SS14]|uniref:Uncharacterized protein n=1 Tax=Sphaerobolus stellatus (strain SS14) TaxID=990650 RepID=A0A0C9UM55_SPHS4|nr:hypothetical protein M422DRAFT_272559 [Sphaerobolus stellatus SS14]